MELYCYYVMIVVPVIARTCLYRFLWGREWSGKEGFQWLRRSDRGVAHW